MNVCALNSRQPAGLAASLLIAVMAACTASDDTEPAPELTRDEAREQSKFDHFTDWCDRLRWYGDGVCDEFCLRPDPDCAAECIADSDCAPIVCITTPCPANVCEDNECVVRTRECEVDTDCPQPYCLPGGPCPTFVCNDEYMCERENESQCRSDDDCPQPHCLPGGPCPTFTCNEGMCEQSQPQCRTDDDCPQVLCRFPEPCNPFSCVAGECRNDGSCITNDDCGAGHYCSATGGTCGQPGTCNPIPSNPFCGQAIVTYCGCDGETHTSNNTCVFDRIDHYGPCAPASCQPVLCELHCQYGFATNADGCEICSCAMPCGPAQACPAGKYCDYQDERSGNTTNGICKPLPFQ